MPLYRTISVGTTSTVIVPTTSITGSRWVTVKNVGQQPVTIGNDVLGPGVDRNYFLSDTQTLNAVTSGGTTTVEVADAQATQVGPRLIGAASDVVFESWVTGEAYPRERRYADGLVVFGPGTSSPAAVPAGLLGESLGSATAGESTISRGLSIGSSNAFNASQAMQLCYFYASRTETVTTARVVAGGTAAGATPTLVRYGLYLIDSSGGGTLVASTANDTTLLAATFTPYPKALSASYTKIRGQRYAFGVLVVSGATMPTVYGATYGGTNSNIATTGIGERGCGYIASQADLPASFVAGSVTQATNQNFRIYAELY